MLEKVYSNENGDIGQANRLPPSFKMPKNVRQIGNNSSDKKIYVEDYVMTFIRQLAGDNYSSSKTAVLVGQYVRIENASMIFISGALELEGFDLVQGIHLPMKCGQAFMKILKNILWNVKLLVGIWLDQVIC